MAIPDPNKTAVVDVDGTILTTVGRDYENSRPIVEVVAGLRALKEAGWHIILHTARGMGRSGNNIELVREQVTEEITSFCEKFDVPYDELIIGKPWGRVYIDDRGMRPEEFAAKYKELLQ